MDTLGIVFLVSVLAAFFMGIATHWILSSDLRKELKQYRRYEQQMEVLEHERHQLQATHKLRRRKK